MGIIKGGFSRLFQTFLYFLAFCCSAIILGVYRFVLLAFASHELRY